MLVIAYMYVRGSLLILAWPITSTLYTSLTWYLPPFPWFFSSPFRLVGPCTRCNCMRRQTLGVRSLRLQRIVPRYWRSFAGGRSIRVKSLMAGGYFMSTPTIMDGSTSWRRENTASLVTGVPSVLLSNPSGASQNNLTSIPNVERKRPSYLTTLFITIHSSLFCDFKLGSHK